MSLREEIIPYMDGNGLVAPHRVPPGTLRASDNGPLYTAQYLILYYRDQHANDPYLFNNMMSCVDSDRYLHRAPDDTTYGNPDNHYGALSALNVIGFPSPMRLPIKCWHPALLYLQHSLHRDFHCILLTLLLAPLVAIIIALSNMSEGITETSNKMLTWTLIQGTQRSFLCRLAGRIWYYRMRKEYDGDIAWIPRIYFEKDHPFVKYFK